MNCKIQLKVNPNQQVWLSPIVNGEILKMLQNITITISRVAVGVDKMASSAGVNGPGDVSCVILRKFSNLVSKSDFESAVLSYCDDPDWSLGWDNEDDLRFSYSGVEPFDGSVNEYKFVWRNFYTSILPGTDKRAEVSAEAYCITGCTDGVQEVCTVQLAYPAYIISLAPDAKKTEGIVKTDEVNNVYTVSQNTPFELKWTGVADLTDAVILRKNGVRLERSFTISDSYDNGKVTKDAAYELTVTNSYNFSDIRALTIQKTNWRNGGAETGVFAGDIYGDRNYNSRIFVHEDEYYAYKHPALYKRNKSGTWSEVAKNSLYVNSDYACFAAYLYNGALYIAGNVKNSDYFSFCRYDIMAKTWQTDIGRVRVPAFGETAPMCCGFAISARYAYFYRVSDGYIAANLYEEQQGWNGGQFYFNAPDGMKIIGGTLGFYVNQFYMAMLCAENQEGGGRYAYLYDCKNESEKFLFKLKVSQNSSVVTMLGTDNHLWLQTENELINCDEKAADKPFFPTVPDGKRVWLGSDKGSIFGIFPDKNIWFYEE